MDFRNPWLIGKATWWSWYGLLTLLWQWCVENSMFAKLLSQPHGTSEHSTKPNIFPEKYWNQKIEWINPCQLAVPFNTDWFFRTNNVCLWTSFRVLGAQIRIRKSNLPHALRKACTYTRTLRKLQTCFLYSWHREWFDRRYIGTLDRNFVFNEAQQVVQVGIGEFIGVILPPKVLLRFSSTKVSSNGRDGISS